MADRKIKLSVRLGSDQYQHLKRNAEAANMKMEPLIRALIMGADIRPRPPAE